MGCLLVTVAVHAVVGVDDLGDATELALNAAALAWCLASIILSLFVVRATRVAALRASVMAMSLLVVCLGGTFARLAYADVSIELADLIEPVQAAEATTQIVVGPTGQDVRLTGDIKEGAADILEKILVAHPAVERIHLTSDGGFADEGQALAEVIAAHHLTTYVPDYCVSACTLAFVGGRDRILIEGARLGFHGPYRQGVLGQTFAGDAKDQRAAYIKAGLSSEFVDEALKFLPDDVWFPERDRLLAAHAATGYVDRYRFPDSILDGAADRRGSRDAVLRNFPMLAGIDKVSPPTIDRIADWYLRAYRHGWSEGRATDGLEAIVSATVTSAFARADDATLADLARFVLSAMQAELSPRACIAIGKSVDLVRAAAVLEEIDKDTGARAESLVTRALASRRTGSPVPRAMPVAFVLGEDTCASLRQIYVEALRHRDFAPLRARLAKAAPDAGGLLASFVAEEH